LIERTTRRMWLTDAGREYHRRCSAVIAELAEADSIASEEAPSPRGVLRVTSSVSFAMMHIAPALPEFLQRYQPAKIRVFTDLMIERVKSPNQEGRDITLSTCDWTGIL